MSKKIWGFGGIVTVVALVAGGNIYADKSLESFYQKNQNTEMLSIQYKNYQMGLSQGSVDWSMKVTPDLCKKTEFIVLKGRDQISRGLKGYQIQSSATVVEGNEKARKYLSHGLKANTSVNWLGQSHTLLKLPAIHTTEQGLTVQMDAMSAELKMQAIPGQPVKATMMALSVPAVQMTDGKSSMLTQGIRFETTQGLNDEYLEDGKTSVSVASMSRTENAGQFSGEMKNLLWQATTRLEDQSVDVDSQLKIGLLNMSAGGVFRDFIVNMNLRDVNRQRMQSFFDLVRKTEESCVDSKEADQALLQSMLNVIGEGFAFESEGNQMLVDGGTGKASLSGKVMPGRHVSIQSLMQIMPSLLDFNATVEFDKNLMRSIMNNYMKQAGKTISDKELEAMLAGMQQTGKVKRTGDKMAMTLDYKYGQVTYLNK